MSAFDPFAIPAASPPSSAPTNATILAHLKPWDGSGTGVFGKLQAQAAVKAIPGLTFTDAELEEMLSVLEATSGGTIRIEPLAQQVAFEAAKKVRKASPAPGQSPGQLNTGLSINVFDEAGHATISPKDDDKPPSPSFSGSLNSPGVMGLPPWYGNSVRDQTPEPFTGGVVGTFPRSVSADPFQAPRQEDPMDIFGLFPTETRDDSHLQTTSTKPSTTIPLAEPTMETRQSSEGWIAPPRQRSQPGTPNEGATIGWGTSDQASKKKKKKKRKKRTVSREISDDIPEPEMTPDPESAAPAAPADAASSEAKTEEKQQVDALAEMKRGTAMLKYGRRGFPHFRRFQISSDNRRLLWFSKKKATADTSVLIQDIVDVKEGQQTEVFKQCTQPALERASFSIIYGSTYKTLDVVAKSREEAQMWVKGIRTLAEAARNGNLDGVDTIPVMVNFTDITKPRYREQMGKKKSVGPYNNPELTRVIQRNLDQCKQRYQALVQMANTDRLRNSDEFENVNTLLAEMEERLEDVQLGLTQKTAALSSLKRDTWVIKVDITVLEEKVKVINRGG